MTKIFSSDLTLSQWISTLRSNWQSALAVSLINIPLSISLAIASLGSGNSSIPLLGIITALWAGLFASLFASNRHNIYGPAGALSGVLLAFTFAVPDGIQYLPILTIVVGVMIFLVYLLRISRYITLIPSTVLHGFLLGVGITIGLGQLASALGITPSSSHESLGGNTLQIFRQISETNLSTLAIFLLSFIFLLIFKRLVPKIPGAIPLTVLAILGSISFHSQLSALGVMTLSDRFHGLEFHLTAFPDYPSLLQGLVGNPSILVTILKYALIITAIAILETLISAKIAEKMTKVGFEKETEVRGLALANLASGLVGGMPATAVLVRTALNAKSGATSRVSAFLVVIFTLFISWVLFDFFVMLPMAVIAAILMNIALTMIDIRLYRNIFSIDRFSFFLVFVVGLLTAFDDPIHGILFGTVVSLMVFIGKVSKGKIDLTIFRDGHLYDKMKLHKYIPVQKAGDTIIYRFAGVINYLNIEPQLEKVRQIKNPGVVVFSFGQVGYIDLDGVEILSELFEYIHSTGAVVYFTGVSSYMVEKTLEKIPYYREIEEAGRIHRSSATVLEELRYYEKKVHSA